ncbi:MAG: DUF1553 domain-containing protein [Candidatus Omnitrophica bacterium]|nr:DUF1553 domain-containing protein [Candidatus Omnitrophota bacterium]
MIKTEMCRWRGLPIVFLAFTFILILITPRSWAVESETLKALIDNLEDLNASPESIIDLQRRIQNQSKENGLTVSNDEVSEIENHLREIEQRQAELAERIQTLKSAQELLPALDANRDSNAPAPPDESSSSLESPIDFGSDIKPILSNKCFTCHGPDENQRKAGLRLDHREGVLGPLKSGGFAVVAGKPDQSELFHRVSTSDEADKMPPANSGESLTPEEIERIRMWIEQGADWEEHWSFVPPVRPDLPQVSNAEWVRNEVDAFVLARLEKEGLSPSKEAGRRRLIRRVSLDLTGLPPTLAEQEKYLKDSSPDWYEKMVEDYLGSKHFGERMAIQWLDLARYADSDGYHIDYEKSFWQYRDWVIDAFNNNKPFDEFTIEQLAGDLLPNPTLDQMVATAFNRNGMTSTEGGADPKEYLTKYVIDRVVTTSTVWLGLTVGCAECHEHKYDPITHEEFYQLYDFFNQLPEQGLDKDPCPPFIKVPSKDQQSRLEDFNHRLASLDTQLDKRLSENDPQLAAGFKSWAEQAERVYDRDWEVVQNLQVESEKGTAFEKIGDGAILAKSNGAATDTYTIRFNASKPIAGFRLEALPHPELPAKGSGLASNGNFMLSRVEVSETHIAFETKEHTVGVSKVYADFEQDQFPAQDILDDNPVSGWAVLPQVERYHRIVFNPESTIGGDDEVQVTLRLKFHHIAPQHLLGHFRLSVTGEKDPRYSPWFALGPFPSASKEEAFAKDFGPESEIDLTKTYLEGDLRWTERGDLTDGAVHDLEGTGIAATYLYRTVYTPKERKVLWRFGSNDGIQVWLNGERIVSNDIGRQVSENQEKALVELKPGDNRLLMKINNRGGAYGFYFRPDLQLEGTEDEIARAFRVAQDHRTEEDSDKIHRLYRLAVDPVASDLNTQIGELKTNKSQLESSIPTIRVMEDMKEKRPTYVLIRGNYRNPGEEVTAGVPAFLPDLPKDQPVNRLALAKWLVSDEQPLTARVTVNRIWSLFFGLGLVKTSEDFGTQGERPSHPKLLDWLAVDFRESGWKVKDLIRKIVLSSTYRQDSIVSRALLQRDPLNRLLARGPRRRLSAEFVRDNALAIAGLLDRDRSVGGPSVRPYQPVGLWKEKAIFGGDTAIYTPDTGPNLYRRGLYTFWKRSVPYPSFSAFDAPSREVCTAQREVTNTPLQAFVTLNAKTYVEAARNFAQRILLEGGQDFGERIDYAYRVALARRPTDGEKQILSRVLEKSMDLYRENPEAADKLLTVGESPRDEDLPRVEHAAWTPVANVILNLDETLTKE